MVILKSCQNQSVAAQQTLCNFGEPSDKMFILLYGKLSIYSKEGAQVARIEPVAPVGEMGLFTGEPRSATVKASEAATLFVLSNVFLPYSPVGRHAIGTEDISRSMKCVSPIEKQYF